LADQRLDGIVGFDGIFNLLAHVLTEVDHGFDVGEEESFLLIGNQLGSLQWLLDIPLDDLEILDVGLLSGLPFLQDVKSLLGVAHLFLPLFAGLGNL
jgi:hypothetical protein